MKKTHTVKSYSWNYGTGAGKCGLTYSKLAEAFVLLGGKHIHLTYPVKVKFNKKFTVKKDKNKNIIIETDDSIVFIECYYGA